MPKSIDDPNADVCGIVDPCIATPVFFPMQIDESDRNEIRIFHGLWIDRLYNESHVYWEAGEWQKNIPDSLRTTSLCRFSGIFLLKLGPLWMLNHAKNKDKSRRRVMSETYLGST